MNSQGDLTDTSAKTQSLTTSIPVGVIHQEEFTPSLAKFKLCHRNGHRSELASKKETGSKNLCAFQFDVKDEDNITDDICVCPTVATAKRTTMTNLSFGKFGSEITFMKKSSH